MGITLQRTIDHFPNVQYCSKAFISSERQCLFTFFHFINSSFKILSAIPQSQETTATIKTDKTQQKWKIPRHFASLPSWREFSASCHLVSKILRDSQDLGPHRSLSSDHGFHLFLDHQFLRYIAVGQAIHFLNSVIVTIV